VPIKKITQKYFGKVDTGRQMLFCADEIKRYQLKRKTRY